MLILLPFIEVLDDGDLGEVYTGLFNFDINNIVSIEPDKKGNTTVFQKIGGTYYFKIPCSEFIEYIIKSVQLDISFLKDVKRYDKEFGRVMDRIIIEQNNR